MIVSNRLLLSHEPLDEFDFSLDVQSLDFDPRLDASRYEMRYQIGNQGSSSHKAYNISKFDCRFFVLHIASVFEPFVYE